MTLAMHASSPARFVLTGLFALTEGRRAIRRRATYPVLLSLVAEPRAWVTGIRMAQCVPLSPWSMSRAGSVAYADGAAGQVGTSVFGHERSFFR